ncbi:hypothetical protein CWC46_01305 [Prodigiosinella confusarubida]|uniref:Uncharacterized protein n=1 Tax=Serratia sp. (strain ATCC 39006) TaxID=104623 RepID=A0A2I5TE94_SERS3|nr:hypothetical protein CWC46_01305 [Serratia sp. ATCC 39006]AUH02894.1 hypothetical protein Ser39006_001305 [Serratia sp. ATCC 39006]
MLNSSTKNNNGNRSCYYPLGDFHIETLVWVIFRLVQQIGAACGELSHDAHTGNLEGGSIKPEIKESWLEL